MENNNSENKKTSSKDIIENKSIVISISSPTSEISSESSSTHLNSSRTSKS